MSLANDIKKVIKEYGVSGKIVGINTIKTPMVFAKDFKYVDDRISDNITNKIKTENTIIISRVVKDFDIGDFVFLENKTYSIDAIDRYHYKNQVVATKITMGNNLTTIELPTSVEFMTKSTTINPDFTYDTTYTTYKNVPCKIRSFENGLSYEPTKDNGKYYLTHIFLVKEDVGITHDMLLKHDNIHFYIDKITKIWLGTTAYYIINTKQMDVGVQ